MARAELKRGKVGELRAIARSIIRSQAGEIRQMKGWWAAWYFSDRRAGGSVL